MCGARGRRGGEEGEEEEKEKKEEEESFGYFLAGMLALSVMPFFCKISVQQLHLCYPACRKSAKPWPDTAARVGCVADQPKKKDPSLFPSKKKSGGNYTTNLTHLVLLANPD